MPAAADGPLQVVEIQDQIIRTAAGLENIADKFRRGVVDAGQA